MEGGRAGTAGGRLAKEVLLAAGLVLVVGLVSSWVFYRLDYGWDWGKIWPYREAFMRGWALTVGIALLALVMSVGMGLLLMLGLGSGWWSVRIFCQIYVELVRGSPLLVQLLIGYYVVANAFGLRGALGAGSFLLAAYGAAYLGEIFRAAVEGVPASQREAARAVGFDRWQTWRHVVLPQALRRALPATTGQLVTLVKDSSLLSVLGLAELTQQVRMANSASASALEGYLPLLGAYLVMTLPLGWLSRWLEGRWRMGDGA